MLLDRDNQLLIFRIRSLIGYDTLVIGHLLSTLPFVIYASEKLAALIFWIIKKNKFLEDVVGYNASSDKY